VSGRPIKDRLLLLAVLSPSSTTAWRWWGWDLQARRDWELTTDLTT